MISIHDSKISAYGLRLPKGKLNGTVADLKTVPTHYTMRLSYVTEEQESEIRKFIHKLNKNDNRFKFNGEAIG